MPAASAASSGFHWLCPTSDQHNQEYFLHRFEQGRKCADEKQLCIRCGTARRNGGNGARYFDPPCCASAAPCNYNCLYLPPPSVSRAGSPVLIDPLIYPPGWLRQAIHGNCPYMCMSASESDGALSNQLSHCHRDSGRQRTACFVRGHLHRFMEKYTYILTRRGYDGRDGYSRVGVCMLAGAPDDPFVKEDLS